MKIHYYLEQYQGQYLVKSKIGGQLFGNHATQDEALEQIIFLESLKQPRFIEACPDISAEEKELEA